MKKIAIFAIFLMATIMTFGQLVPDEQYLPTCSVKTVNTKFTKFIPSGTVVMVGNAKYILQADGGVGNTITNMLAKGTAIVDPCCASFPSISAVGATTTINGNTDVTGKLIINDGTVSSPDMTAISAYFQNDIKVHGHLIGLRNANCLKVGSSLYAGDTLFGRVGYFTMLKLGYGADSTNILISPKSYITLPPASMATGNVLIGIPGTYMTTAADNTIVGEYAGVNLTSGATNVFLGVGAGSNEYTGTQNTYVGTEAGGSCHNTTSNVAVGVSAAQLNTGSYGIFLGEFAGYHNTGNNKLVINNNIGGQDTAIIYGVMNGTPATNTIELNAAATVNGSLTVNTTSLLTGSVTASALPSFTIAAGTCTHAVPTVLDTCGVAVIGLTTNGLAMCQYATFYAATDTLAAVYQYKAGWITFQGKYNRTIKYWIPKK